MGLFVLGFGPWSDPQSPDGAGFVALVLAVSIASALDPRRSGPEDQAAMRLSFLSNLGALLLFGPVAMTFVATIGASTRAVTGSPRFHPIRHGVLDVVTAVVASQAAGFAYAALGGTPAPFGWPWQGVPIGAAVVAYSFVMCGVADLIVPLTTGVPATRSWPRDAIRGMPSHFIGAGISVALVEAIEHRTWGVLMVAALPLYFAWRAYTTQGDRLSRHHRRLDAAASSDVGVSIVDDNGRVTLWNEALARLLECPAQPRPGPFARRRVARPCPVRAPRRDSRLAR